MAGPTIGRAEIQVDLDGNNIPRQTRALGEAAGLGAGGAFNDRFMASLKKLSDQLRPVTDKIGNSLRGFFRKLGPSMAEAGADAGDQMGKGLEKSFKRSWTNIGRSLGDGLTRALTPATRDASQEIDQLGSTMEKTFGSNGGRGLDRMGKALVRLGDNSRTSSNSLGDLLRATRSLGPASRNSGREIDRMGQSMERSFSDGGGGRGLIRMRRDVDRLGDSSRESSIDIGEMFQVFEDGTSASDRMTDSTNRQADAADRNGGSWGRTNSVMSDMFGRMRGWTDGFDRHTRATNNSARAAGNHSNRSMELNFNFDKLTDSLNRNSEATGRNEGSQRSLWRRMSANSRQWILIGAAIAAAGTEIAILGSAAGSSLAVLGTVATAVGVAVAVGIAGFQGMTGPLQDIAPAARPAAVALKNMSAAMGKLQDGIQASLFADLAGPFNELTGALPKLQDGLNGIAGAVGIVIGSFAKGLASPRGIEVMNRLLGGMQGIIVGLGDVVVNLGSALGTIFVAALPSTNLFITALEDMTDRFRIFLQSAEGQSALADFFNTLETVMPPLVDLLGATGRMLAGLVTPDSIARFVAFTDNLTEFMPMLGTFLAIVGELNIFGVLAEVLVAFGQAMAPLAPGLFDLAGAVSSTLVYLLQAAVGPLAAVAEAFAPLLDAFTQALTGSEHLGVGIGQLVAVLFGPLSEGFVLWANIATDFVAEFGSAFGSIFIDLINAVAPLIPIFFEVTGAILQVAAAFVGPALSGVEPIISVLGTLFEMLAPLSDLILLLVPAAETFGKAVADFMVVALGTFLNMLPSIMEFFGSLGPVILAFGDFFVSLGPIIGQFISVLATNLGPILTSIGELLVALAPIFFQLVTAVFEVGIAFGSALLPAIAPLIEKFTEMVPLLMPIVDAIADLAPTAALVGGVIGDILLIALDTLVQILPSLVDFIVQLADVFKTVMDIVGPYLGPIFSALAEVIVALVPVVLNLVMALITGLLPALPALLDALFKLIPIFLPLIDVIVALTPTVALLAGMIVDILVLALDALLPLFPALIQIIEDLAPLIPPLAEFLGTVLVVAIELLAALLPPLVSIFMSLWETVKPLIPLIILLLDVAMFPLTMAAEILIPLIGFLMDVFAELLDPIMKMITPMDSAESAFSGLSDTIGSGMDTIKDWGDTVGIVLDGAIGWIRDTIGWFEDLFGASSQDFSGGSSRRGSNNTATFSPTATGGRFNSPSYRLIAEDGPEAVVPLNRDLSQVDPAVRALSAFAQGMGGAGSGASAGRQVYVAPGAIVVQTVANPQLTASAVLDRLVASAR